jgi:hypothetical protein
MHGSYCIHLLTKRWSTDGTIGAWLILHTFTDQSLVIRERACGPGREDYVEGTGEPGVGPLRRSPREAAGTRRWQRFAFVQVQGHGPAGVGLTFPRCPLARGWRFSLRVPIGFPTM